MPSRRADIVMSEAEMKAFLEEERVVTCAAIGPNGRPHLMPLWYVLDGPAILAWTYAKSQKAKNLERVPQATLQVEAGRDQYSELRGVMLECDVELIRDPNRVEAIGLALFRRYAGLAPDAEVPAEARANVERQAAKRVGLRFVPTRAVSWDHRKLGGRY